MHHYYLTKSLSILINERFRKMDYSTQFFKLFNKKGLAPFAVSK
jgi:hypothetical protein